MISTFFNKTKPINYAVLLSFLFAYYWATFWVFQETPSSQEDWLMRALAAAALLLTVVAISLIVRQSKVTEYNSYPMLFFVVVSCAFPVYLADYSLVIANLFVLISAYKLIYLNPDKKPALTFYNASLMILIGSLFEPMCIAFMIAIGLGVYMNDKRQIKDWLAPLAALLTGFIWLGAAAVVKGQDPWSVFNMWDETVLLVWDAFRWEQHGPLIGFLLLSVLTAIFFNIRQGHQVVGKIIPLRLITAYLFIAIILFILQGIQRPSTIMYSFFPASILMSYYAESVRRSLWKEIFLILVLLIPFITLILGLF